MMKKRLLSLLLVIALLLPVTMMGETTPDADMKGKVEVFLWLSSYPEALEQMVTAFNQKYPNIEVGVQTMTGGGLVENLEPRIQGGMMPDIISVDIGPWFYAQADAGYFKDISNTKSWQYQADAVKRQWTSPKGTKYGISYGVAEMLMYYNKDLFKQAGIEKLPENWEEFLAVCAQLKEKGITPLAWNGGFANMLGHTAVAIGIANEILPNEPDFMNQVMTTNYNYDTDAWKRVFSRQKELADLGYFNDGFMSTDYAESVRVFANNEVAMTIQGSWSAGDLLTLGDHVGLFIPPWNDAGKPVVGVMGGETGFGRGNTDNPAADLFFEFITFDNYPNFQNFLGSVPIYPEEQAKGVKIDPRLLEISGIFQSNPTQPLAFQYLPAPVYSAMRQFAQEVLAGSQTPDNVGAYLNPVQKEYFESLSK